MKSDWKIVIVFFFLQLFSIMCYSQYFISKDTLINQLRISGTEKHIFVKGNDLKMLVCYDKNGKKVKIEVSDLTTVRIFEKNSNKVKFYLNTIILTDSTVTGSKTHFFKYPIKPIPLDSIARIQIMK